MNQLIMLTLFWRCVGDVLVITEKRQSARGGAGIAPNLYHEHISQNTYVKMGESTQMKRPCLGPGPVPFVFIQDDQRSLFVNRI